MNHIERDSLTHLIILEDSIGSIWRVSNCAHSSNCVEMNSLYSHKTLTLSPIFRQNYPYAHVNAQRWHAPRLLQMCLLTSLIKYFGSTMTIAPSREVQSWKKGSLWRALDIFARYLEPILDKISVGWFVLYPQELNPARYDPYGLC